MFLTESQDKHFIFCVFKNEVHDKVSLTDMKEVIILITTGLLDDTMISYDTTEVLRCDRRCPKLFPI